MCLIFAPATQSMEKRFYCPVGGSLVIDGHKTRIYDHGRILPPNPPCHDLVTPACIRALYDIPLADPNGEVSTKNTLGIFSADDIYYQGSLDLFNEQYTNIPAGYAPIFHAIDNSQRPPTQPHSKFWKDVAGEGNADIEASMPIIYVSFMDKRCSSVLRLHNYLRRKLTTSFARSCSRRILQLSI